MFQGTIPADLRSIVVEHAAGWDVSDIWVGCSGAFTIQRILARHPARLHGNDVQLYSCSIGAYLAGEPIPIGIADEHREEWGWLEPSLATPAGAVATVMLSTRMLTALGRTNAYYERMRAGYRAQWADLHARTVARVEATTLRLASFFAGDVMEFLDRCPPESAFIAFPPFWAHGYEAMYANLEKVFTWPNPAYPEFDPATGLAPLFARMDERRHWLIVTGDPMVGRERQLRGRVQTGRGKPIYVYASGEARRLVIPRTVIEPVFIPRRRPGDELTGRLRLVALTSRQFDALRSQYLAAGIVPARAQLAFGVMVGERLVGAFGLQITSLTQKVQGLTNYAYLLADFAVAPTDEPRLSKLVVIAALSLETRRMAERMSYHRIRLVTTTAFSANPVSMKYRGLFRLTQRKPHLDAFGNSQWALNYASDAGRWTLQEGFELWRSKHRGSPSEPSGSGSATSSSSRSTPGTCDRKRSGRSSRTSAATVS